MTLNKEDIIENWEQNPIENPVSQAQIPFKEKAFCIVWDEMKAKMEALGLDEEDLVNMISPENNIYRYLKLIDTFFNYLLELKLFFIKKENERIEKYKPKPHENIANQDELNKKWDKEILINTKTELCNLIFHYEELSTLFSHFPKEWVKIIVSCLKKNKIFDLIIALRKWIEKYNFSWDLLIEFFEKVTREISTSISDQKGPENSFDLLLQAYENLSKYIKTPTLFDDLIKLSISTWKEEVWFLLNTFIMFNEENIKKLADYSEDNNSFYNKCLTWITEFIVKYPDKWDYLLKIWEIFGKNIPWILSIWKGFINELLKYFPENYEEILLEVRDVWEHIHGWNEWNLLTWWLKFLAKFLEEWKEIFFKNLYELRRINDEKLKQNHNTWWIFFEDWLDFVSRYIMHLPDAKDWKWIEICERVVKIINKHYSNKDNDNTNNFFRLYMLSFNQYIWYQLIDEDITLLDELLNFLEKVWWSKDALRIIKSLWEITFDLPDDDEIRDYITINKRNKQDKNAISSTLAYLLKHKKSKIIPFIKNLNLIKDLNLWVNIHQVLLGWVSLEYKSNEELQELFVWEKAEDTKVWKYFIKIWWQNHQKLVEMKVWINSIIPKKWKLFDKSKIISTLIKIQNVFAENMQEYFEKVIHKKIHIKFKKEFGLSKDFDDSLLNENLFELYKMYSSTTINKKHAFELIQRYLNGEVYTWNWDILQTYPYNRSENRKFLKRRFWWRKDKWLSRNEKVYDIEEEGGVEEKTDNIPERISHHLKVANEKFEILEIKDEKWNLAQFKTHWKLIDYFDTKLKTQEDKYRGYHTFADLAFQIKAIKDLLKTKRAKKVSKIKIYHELEPLKIAMMWNWVDNSCLSYYSSVWNYWSAITNALEVNKWVFYIEDEHGNVIARVLVWIDDEGGIDVHPMYFKWNIGIDLNRYFNEYIEDLITKMWHKNLKWYRLDVELLFCDDWYSWD